MPRESPTGDGGKLHGRERAGAEPGDALEGGARRVGRPVRAQPARNFPLRTSELIQLELSFMKTYHTGVFQWGKLPSRS